MKLTSEWAAVIVAAAALTVSVISCVHTRASNSISERLARLEEARYEETHSPAFSLEYSFPEWAVTNSVETRKFIRDLKIYNRGYPVQEVCSVMIETFALVAVFDKVTVNEPEKIVPQHHAFYVALSNQLQGRYYKTYRNTFDTQGLLFEVEHGDYQEALLAGYLSYKAAFPKREVHIDIVDITTLDYKDHKGEHQRAQFLNGTLRHVGDLNSQIREGHAIMTAIQDDDKKHSRHTTLFTILEYCYANENALMKRFRTKVE